jgi:hypothetical protein
MRFTSLAASILPLVASASIAAAQAVQGGAPPPLPAVTYHGRSGQLQVSPPRVAEEIRVDGSVTEAAWSSAAILTGFSQYSPVDGVPAADSTEVRVIYADHAIYFAIRAFETHGAVIATRADRDRITGDDHVRLLIDTFNDRRRAFLFAVNPFGIQSDGTFTDNSSGGATDLNPDFIFESRGRVTETGYEVEVRIPFKSIRYQQTPVQNWGISIVRAVQHSGHEQTWTPADRGNPSFLGQAGTLTGLRELRRGLVLDLNPVMTAQAVGEQRSPTNADWTYRRERPEYSGNVRWGATQSLTVSGTVNPDFSQIEADVGQVVYDPRSALFFPEKRPFFLEASENFEVPNSLIYTRSIVDPVGAAKVAGKIGDFNVGILSAVDDEAISFSGRDKPVFNIARIRRDFAARSTAGVLYTDRVEGSSYNRVAGADTRIIVGDYTVLGQLAASFTGGVPGQSAAGKPLFELNVVKSGRASGFSAVIEGVHTDFVAGSGFISRPGIARANLTPRFTFFPANRRLEAISFSPIVDLTWEWDRFERGTEPNDIKLQTRTSASWRGGWRASLFTFVESFKYPPSLYANYYIERRDATGAVTDTVSYVGTDRLPNYGFDLSVNTPQFQTFTSAIGITGGHDENFDEWSSAWIFFTNLNADWRPTERVRLNARYVDQRYYRTSDGSLVRRRMIPRLKLEYQLSRPIFVRLVSQYDTRKVDALRDDTRTGFPILLRQADGTFTRADAQQRGGLRSDVLFSFQPNPGTVFFAGYGASHGASEFSRLSELERTADAFFVKASYLIRN